MEAEQTPEPTLKDLCGVFYEMAALGAALFGKLIGRKKPGHCPHCGWKL